MSDICELGAASINENTGALSIQAKGVALSEDENDAPDFGQVMYACSLGLTALPYPRDENGAAEGIVDDSVPGLSGVLIGARDLRTIKVIGNAKGGDTILHSTGPNQSAQVQCKEAKRQVVCTTKDTRGRDMVVMLDGKNDKISIAGMGLAIQGDRDSGWVLSAGGSASIQIKGDSLILSGGSITIGGRTPVAAFAGCAPGNIPPGPATTGVPVTGVFYGV